MRNFYCVSDRARSLFQIPLHISGGIGYRSHFKRHRCSC